jgi:hypothetical protein
VPSAYNWDRVEVETEHALEALAASSRALPDFSPVEVDRARIAVSPTHLRYRGREPAADGSPIPQNRSLGDTCRQLRGCAMSRSGRGSRAWCSHRQRPNRRQGHGRPGEVHTCLPEFRVLWPRTAVSASCGRGREAGPVAGHLSGANDLDPVGGGANGPFGLADLGECNHRRRVKNEVVIIHTDGLDE